MLGWALLAGCSLFGTPEPPAPALAVDHGVDAAARSIRIAALNDESGPTSAIGRPYAIGKRLLVARVNAGGSGLMPEGWTVELVERDHGYRTEDAQRALDELKDEVLFVATSFGTEPTLALRDTLEQADLVAFPGSLSTALQGHALTPPLGASYESEARRAVDFAVAEADGRPVRLATIRRSDTYGSDVARGVADAARAWGLAEPLELPVDQGADTIGDRMQAEGVTHAILGTLPPETVGLLEDARARGSSIGWVGTTPAWSDALTARPDAGELLARYHQTSSLPFWGEEVPGMSDFLQAFEAWGGGVEPDGYVLISYVQGIVQLRAAGAAIEAGDATRAGYRRALARQHEVDAGGMLPPLDLSALPGPVTERVRILKPRLGEGPRFEEVMPLQIPGPRRERPGQAAMDDEANVGSNPGEVTGEIEGAP